MMARGRRVASVIRRLSARIVAATVAIASESYASPTPVGRPCSAAEPTNVGDTLQLASFPGGPGN
jgi:hypothetical protein